MEFGDHHHHREDEDEDEEEEEGSEEMLMMMNNNTRNTDSNININNTSSGLNRVKMADDTLSQVQIQPAPPPMIAASCKPRYRECLRNHAINVMGHALDGCGEFMPGGPEGSVEALKCAACGCHRNFHRKEEAGDATTTAALLYPHHQQPPPPQAGPFGSYYRTTPSGYLHLRPPPQPRPLALPSTSGAGGSMSRGDDDDVSNPNNGAGMVVMGNGNSCGKKRFRTKFTAEQKGRMLAMAERIGWRIRKCDEELVLQFCHETGVKRHVFKVWMHNNKHILGKTTINISNNNNNNNNSSSSNSSKQQQQLMS